MHVSHLRLANFRNYEAADLALSPGIHVFAGGNGQGKTNLVEAIAYLSSLRSHRVSQDAPLVRVGQDAAVLHAELRSGARTLRIGVEVTKQGSNMAQVGGRQVTVRELSRFFTTVVFAPEDLALVRGDPGERRDLLDALLVTHSHGLNRVLSGYDRALRQRNALLKNARGRSIDEGMLEIWDTRLIEFGSRIIAERLALVGRLRPHLAAAYATLTGAEHGADLGMRVSALDDSGPHTEKSSISVQNPNMGTFRANTGHFGTPPNEPGHEHGLGEHVSTPQEIAAAFAQALSEARSRERERGVTLVGPHRDDGILWLNGLPARTTASHGESWTLALALKLAAAELVRAESKTGDPVLILDDVFAELDANRRSRLAAAIADYEQVLITCAVLTDVPEPLRRHIVRIEAGRILDPAVEPADRQPAAAPPAAERADQPAVAPTDTASSASAFDTASAFDSASAPPEATA